MKISMPFSAVTLILVAVLFGGCTVYHYDGTGQKYTTEKFERTVDLSESLGLDSKFSAQTSNGSITVTGTEDETCQVTANLTAYAATIEEAQLLAEQTEIKLERTADGLRAVIVRPELKSNESVCISYDVKIPQKTTLDLKTSYGKITVTHIAAAQDIHADTSNGKIEMADCSAETLQARTSYGSIDVRQTPAQSMDLHTSNGSIKCEAVTGNLNASTAYGSIDVRKSSTQALDLHTSNGSITCQDITGNLTASTSYGSVNIRYAPNAPNPADIRITNSNGRIDLTVPKNYSAKVDAKTSNGKIRTGIPITVQGEIGTTLNGVIGTGEGNLYLQTSYSSISIN